MTFPTKIVIVLLDSLEIWQKLNVTAFLMSGVVGKSPDLIGKPYQDKSGELYSALNIHPVIVLSAEFKVLTNIHKRAINRSVECSVYIRDMFVTGHDEANRATVLGYNTQDLPLVGLALKEEKKLVDKITKGAKLHS